MRILKEETMAVLVDVQEVLLPHIHDNENLAKNLRILIEGLKTMGVDILVSEQYTKGLGHTVETLQEVLGEYTPLEKTSFSCCDDENMMEYMEKSGKKFIILTGIESHICVMQTALDLKAKGYEPVIVEDCVGSRSDNNRKVAMNRLAQSGVIVTTYESLLFELCRYSKAPEFRTISKLVK
ncbi:hydrolase [Anaeromicrobium sediminis]|uniref:Hydrolase n=1 Tax=Anaeromicrobium sediminis TaxID=1478221 RepID=A0A267MBE4_9FIRM|nr:hydrolase [Anaeromicrobium sediminis]PAB56904.1 hydrolase [Anaeromicrobium sediminis]